MKQKVEKKLGRPSQLRDDLGSGQKFLILHNDDVNTFSFVIESLMTVCDHDAVQAEQCAFITHHKGKCDVSKGPFKLLDMMRQALIERGLHVTIE